MNKRSKQLLTNPFVISAGSAFLILIILFVAALSWLDSYTNHGEKIIVPNLEGLTEQEAEKILAGKDLQYEVIDSVFVKDKKPGTVKEQTPEHGANVKKERTIYLTVYAHLPQKIVLPDLRDVSLRQAEAIITSIGLKIGGYEYVPSEYKDLVQDIKCGNIIVSPGMRVTEGSSITILVGKGLSDEETSVVSLRGLTLEQAIERAHAFSFNIGATLYDVNPSNEKEKAQYIVYRQDPITNSRISSGQSVSLFLTKDKSLLDIPEEIAADSAAATTEESLWE